MVVVTLELYPVVSKSCLGVLFSLRLLVLPITTPLMVLSDILPPPIRDNIMPVFPLISSLFERIRIYILKKDFGVNHTGPLVCVHVCIYVPKFNVFSLEILGNNSSSIHLIKRNDFHSCASPVLTQRQR
jgi:hypothetical protein